MVLNKKILVFDTESSGHHIEYIHHLLCKANLSSYKYIFYLPEEFIFKRGNELDWSCNQNVEFQYFKNKYTKQEGSFLKNSFNSCRLLKTALIRNDVTHVFLITLISFIPFLPFFLNRKIKVSGILYQIYLYRWSSSTIYQKIIDVIKFLVLRFSNCIDSVYILNDIASANYLNKLYKTKKFTYLADPYVKIHADTSITRETMNIPIDSEVYIHIGDMRARKGTLEILDALYKCSRNEMVGKTFIFAGKVNNEIKDEFYEKIKHLSVECHIIVYDQFCDFSFLGALCNITDYILIPYKQTGQSTGIIGYAAQFMKPVLGPSSGLIGKLIRRYNLGYTINRIDGDSIYNFFVNTNKFKIISQEYLKVSSVRNFIDTIKFK